MTDTSTPNPSDSDGEPPRPRLSLKRNRGANQKDSDASSPVPQKSAESTDTTQPRKKIKLALKPSDAEPAQENEPLLPKERARPAVDEKSGGASREQGASQHPELPAQSADSPVRPPDPLGAAPLPIPPKKAKPAVPQPAVTPEEEQSSGSFDDIEPERAGKPPPPPDAPVHHGPVKPRRSGLGWVMAFILIVALLGVGTFFAFPLLKGDAAPDDQESESAVEPAAPESDATPAVDPLTPVDDTVAPATQAPAETSDATPSTTAPAKPVIPPDANVAARVDGLQISMARPHADEPIIVVAGVVYAPGMLVDPEHGIRFVGFTPQRREVIFEDERGARYYRYF